MYTLGVGENIEVVNLHDHFLTRLEGCDFLRYRVGLSLNGTVQGYCHESPLRQHSVSIAHITTMCQMLDDSENCCGTTDRLIGTRLLLAFKNGPHDVGGHQVAIFEKFLPHAAGNSSARHTYISHCSLTEQSDGSGCCE